MLGPGGLRWNTTGKERRASARRLVFLFLQRGNGERANAAIGYEREKALWRVVTVRKALSSKVLWKMGKKFRFGGLTFDSAAGTGASRRWGGPSRSPGPIPPLPEEGWPSGEPPSPEAEAPRPGRSECRGAAETCCPPRGRPLGGRRPRPVVSEREGGRLPGPAVQALRLILLGLRTQVENLLPRVEEVCQDLSRGGGILGLNWEGSVSRSMGDEISRLSLFLLRR